MENENKTPDSLQKWYRVEGTQKINVVCWVQADNEKEACSFASMTGEWTQDNARSGRHKATNLEAREDE